MLVDREVPRRMEKKVCIRTGDNDLQRTLGSLLECWRYILVDDPTDEVLLLAEEGLCEAEACQQVLWLSHSKYASSERVLLPLVVEDLYVNLERRFHSPPRRHLRISLELPARISCRGEEHVSSLSSLSDRGCRISLPRELARDEPLNLNFTLFGRPVSLAGRVIYSFRRFSGSGESDFDTGVLFAQQDESVCLLVREFILGCYLERMRTVIEPDAFCGGLEYFKLPDRLRRRCLEPARCVKGA